MTPKQNQWSIIFTICVGGLLATTSLNQGLGWVVGLVMFGGFSLMKLAAHGGLDTNEENFDK